MTFLGRRASFGAALVSVLLILAGCGSSAGSSTSTSSPTATGGAASSASSLHLVQSGTLTVGTDATSPPMEYSDPSAPGTYIGADIDLARALAKVMGLKSTQFHNVASFDALIPSLDAQRYDLVMASMNDTPLREKSVDFVDYMKTALGILVNKSGPIHTNTLAGLCGRTVSVDKGTAQLDAIDKANQSCSSKIHILISSGVATYEAFVAGHADAYVIDYPIAAYYVKLHPTLYREAGTPINTGEDYGIAIRKNDPALRASVRSALSKVMANGSYMTILKKWGLTGAALK